VPRTAYLILSHRLPEQLRRLVRTLRAGSPEAVVAVHHDPRSGPVAVPGATPLPASPVEWGHGSHLAALLRCLRELLARDFEWLVVLSGQDYPVRPVGDIEAGLASDGADAFVEAHPLPRPRLRRGRVGEFERRYHYRWRRVPGSIAPLAARADPLVQVRVLPSGTYAGVPAPQRAVYYGADWFSLSRRAVEALVGAPPRLVRRFMHTIVPTEAFVATVLANDPAIRVSTDHRRFVTFDRGAANPRVLRLADLDAVLASGADFARKFDMTVDAAVLDEIDRRVHRF
jgi:hypothetical protein